MIDLVRARAADPAIDAAMIEVDELARMMAVNAVVTAAAAGDMKAIKALTDGTLHTLQEGLASTAVADKPTAGGAWVFCPHCEATILVTGYLNQSLALIVKTVHPRDVLSWTEDDSLNCPPVPQYLRTYYADVRWDGKSIDTLSAGYDPRPSPQPKNPQP